MRLISFKYMQRQPLLILTLVLMIASVLFSITSFGFLGFYKTFNAYLGEEEDIIAIYETRSATPFTGVIPLQLTTRIENISGVIANSPEIIAPTLVRGKSVFFRGVIPEEFSKLNPLTMLEGETLQLRDTYATIVGKRLADSMGLRVGDGVLVLGVRIDRYLELDVKGIYESKSALDDEAIVPLYIGQWLRGTSYQTITVIRVKIDKGKLTPTQLYAAIADEAEASPPSRKTKPSPIEEIIPISNAAINPETIGVKETQEFMKTYLEKSGMTQETLLILSVVVFSFASATLFSASHTLIRQHEHEIAVLRSLGISTKTLRLNLIIKVLPWSIAASLVGVLIAEAALFAMESIGLQALFHTIHFQPDPLLIILNVLLVFAIVVLGIMHSSKKLNPK